MQGMEKTCDSLNPDNGTRTLGIWSAMDEFEKQFDCYVNQCLQLEDLCNQLIDRTESMCSHGRRINKKLIRPIEAIARFLKPHKLKDKPLFPRRKREHKKAQEADSMERCQEYSNDNGGPVEGYQSQAPNYVSSLTNEDGFQQQRGSPEPDERGIDSCSEGVRRKKAKKGINSSNESFASKEGDPFDEIKKMEVFVTEFMKAEALSGKTAKRRFDSMQYQKSIVDLRKNFPYLKLYEPNELPGDPGMDDVEPKVPNMVCAVVGCPFFGAHDENQAAFDHFREHLAEADREHLSKELSEMVMTVRYFDSELSADRKINWLSEVRGRRRTKD